MSASIKPSGIIALFALLLMAPALIWGAPTVDSGAYNHLWTSQFAAEMARGEPYPRWLPQSFEGLGSPTFYFYPPFAYWISGAFALVLDVRHAIAAAGFVLLLASGAAMYLWLRHRQAALPVLGACLYMLAPYHLGDFYARSALAEFGAFVWLPLIALAIEASDRRWGPPLLALSYAGLICTHLPTALLASAILIPPLVLWRAWREPVTAVRCALAGLAGLLLAGFYLAPAILLQRYTLLDQLMWVPRFSPAHWSVFTLFQPGAEPALGVMVMLAFKWTAVAVVALLFRRGRLFWTLMTLWALACAVDLIPLTSLPGLDRVQFPWRALAIAEFAAVTAVAMAPRALLPALAAVVVCAETAFPLATAAFVGVTMPMDPALAANRVDAVEYLPASFRPLPKTMSRPDLAAFAGPLVRGPVGAVTAKADGEITMTAVKDGPVVIRRAVFPRWRVMANGKAIPLGPGPLIGFDARAGQTYRLEAVRTPAETLGLLASLLGVVLTLGLAAPLRSPRALPLRSRGPRGRRTPAEAPG